MPDDDLITPAEAARLLGTTKPRVARMIARGELRTYPARVSRLRRADVLALAPLPRLAPGRPPKGDVRSFERDEDRPLTP